MLLVSSLVEYIYLIFLSEISLSTSDNVFELKFSFSSNDITVIPYFSKYFKIFPTF